MTQYTFLNIVDAVLHLKTLPSCMFDYNKSKISPVHSQKKRYETVTGALPPFATDRKSVV